jgi:HAD domain in Swiss Army Knife RNA repair proteins
LSETLLFLDVDGTLLPFAPRGRVSRPSGNPLLDRLDPADGARLRSLGCSLVWATTWMDDANEVLSPRLGLPRLPVLDWSGDDEPPPLEVHWKTPSLVRWAAGRPFAWLDDEIFDADRRWIADHHAGPALAHRVDPRSGLTRADFEVVRHWLGGVRSLRT